jgi:integrase
MTAKRRPSGQGTLFKRADNGPWIAQWFNHKGKRLEKSTRTTDKRAAERILAKFVSDAALRRERVIDPKDDVLRESAARSIESHLADFEASMQAAHRKPKHVRCTVQIIRVIARVANWSTLADITADGLNHFAALLKVQGKSLIQKPDDTPRETTEGKGASARTVQAYLTAAKSFTRWLTRADKLPRDPLASVQKPNPESDRRRERRMLLPDEWPWLQEATLTGPDRDDISPRERMLLYATAIQTGLRSNELRSLSRGQLFLTVENPFITCKAGSTKNKKDARQYIKADLAEQLLEHIAAKLPTAPVFSMPESEDVADMLRADLALARKNWIEAAKHDPDEQRRRMESVFLAEGNHEGETLDFHSLRHSCGAWLAMTGAHPKAVQSVMRHSSITLTMDTYGHLFPGQEAETVSRFPSMMTNDAEAMRATGTDATTGCPQQYPQQSRHRTKLAGADPCGNLAAADEKNDDRNCLPIAELSEVMPDGAEQSENASCRARTYDPLIKSQRRKQIAGATELLI